MADEVAGRALVIEKRIYDQDFIDNARHLLNLQGKVPTEIAEKVQLVAPITSKDAPLWVTNRMHSGTFKKYFATSVTTGDLEINVPAGKIWEIVAMYVGSVFAGATTFKWDLLRIDGEFLIQVYTDSGDHDRIGCAPAHESVIIGDPNSQSELGGLSGHGVTTDFKFGLGGITKTQPIFARDQIAITLYADMSDATAYICLYYIERNIEDHEKMGVSGGL